MTTMNKMTTGTNMTAETKFTTIEKQTITDESLKAIIRQIDEDEDYHCLSDEFVDTCFVTTDWHHIYDLNEEAMCTQRFDTIEPTACSWLFKVGYAVGGKQLYNLFDTRFGEYAFKIPMVDIQGLDGLFSALFLIDFDGIVQLYNSFKNELMFYQEYRKVEAEVDGNVLVCKCMDPEGNMHEEKISCNERSDEELKAICDAHGIANDF